MRFIINYLRQCFCRHDWELIFEEKCCTKTKDIGYHSLTYYQKIYRCKKCGYSKKYSTK